MSLTLHNVSQRKDKYIYVKETSAIAIENFKETFSNHNFETQMNKDLNSSPEYNCSLMLEKIKYSINQHLPTKKIKFNKYKHANSEWITQGIIKSIKHRNSLYRNLLAMDQNSPEYLNSRTNYLTYNKILKRNIHDAKKNYYNAIFLRHKNNIKETWKNIRAVLNSNAKSNKSINRLKIGNSITTDKTDIVNHLNDFFSSIGVKLTEKIPHLPDVSFAII